MAVIERARKTPANNQAAIPENGTSNQSHTAAPVYQPINTAIQPNQR
jgi:hypothetical protein